MPRKRFSEREVVAIVARQLGVRWHVFGDPPLAFVICPICDDPIEEEDIPTIEKEHERAIGLLGEDNPNQCRYVHQACHRKKTRDDIARIAKAKRQAGETGQRARRKKRTKPLIQGQTFPTNKDGPYKKPFGKNAERRT